MHQIYVEQQYAPVGGIGPGLIIDAGANVGYSTMWFLERYPTNRVTALEPDADSYEIARKNLSADNSRFTLHHAGLWDKACRLRIVESQYRDGRAWTRQVTECDDSAGILGMTVDELLTASSEQRIALLKCDIEGAEAIVFKAAAAWIDKVDAIAIELHDDSHFGSASAAFFAAIAGQEFEVGVVGEVTVCKRKLSF